MRFVWLHVLAFCVLPFVTAYKVKVTKSAVLQLSDNATSRSMKLEQRTEIWTDQKIALIGFDDPEPTATSFRTLTFTKATYDVGNAQYVKKAISVIIIPCTHPYNSLGSVEVALRSGKSDLNVFLDEVQYLMYNDEGTYYLFWNPKLYLWEVTDTQNYFNGLFEEAGTMSKAEKQKELQEVHKRFQADEAKRRKQQEALEANTNSIKARFRKSVLDAGANMTKRRKAYQLLSKEMALAELNDAQYGLGKEAVIAEYQKRETARDARIAKGMGQAHRSVIFRLALKLLKSNLEEYGGRWSRIQEISGITASDWIHKTTSDGQNVQSLVAELHFQEIISGLQGGRAIGSFFDQLFVLVDDLGGTGGFSCDPTCYLIWKGYRAERPHDAFASEKLVAEVKTLIRR